MWRTLVLTLTFIFLTVLPAWAIYNPLSLDNNRVGVHILSPDELDSAAKLVNRNGAAAWGYVTVPIQATDRDRSKWIRFMEKAAEQKVIPIIRVATIVNEAHWEKPDDNDLIDFANFLNDLPWPTQNRYVAIFNEVNRADEFGGAVSPENYADILNNAIDIFKRRSDKFFILPSALDNAAPNSGQYMRFDQYLSRMQKQQPEIFNKIDGWNSHAYANPGFAVSPALSGSNKVDSFKYDLTLLNRYTKKKLPVFITETGWSNRSLDDRTIATFYNHAFVNAWADPQIVAVTPFLLFAGSDPFAQFSLLARDSQPTLAYQAIQAFAVPGSPLLEDYSTPVSSPTTTATPEATASPVVLGQTSAETGLWQKILNFLLVYFTKNPFNKTISVGAKNYQIEIVKSAAAMSVGLAKYDRLEVGQGMLFDLGTKYIPTFWMKNMKFDIDLIWIADDRVVSVSRGLAATPYNLISPASPVNYVLEVLPNSDISAGDTVKINL